MVAVRIRIEGTTLPGLSCPAAPGAPRGYRQIVVGVQRRRSREDLLGPVSGDAPSARWTLECAVKTGPAGTDITGPHIQGGPGGRFIYLSWFGVADTDLELFRRAKLWLDGVAPDVMNEAVSRGLLIGRLGLSDPCGQPLCAGVRPPAIDWTAGTP